MGDSLAASRLAGIENLTAILLTHWHPDHALGLNQIVESHRRAARSRGMDYNKIPLYCTLKTYDSLRERGLSFELSHRLQFHEIIHRLPFTVQATVPITITPISVAHGTVKGAVIYAADVASTRTIFGWDIDVPSSGTPTNLEKLRANLEVLRGANLLLQEANTWKETNGGSGKPTGHTSYQAAREYIRLIQAERTLLVHMSGHEDGVGKPGYGWTDGDWERHVSRDRDADTIGVARQGMLIRL